MNMVRLLVGTALLASDAHSVIAAARHPDAKATYTITSTLELAKPYSVEAMNDAFQDARIVSQTKESCIVDPAIRLAH